MTGGPDQDHPGLGILLGTLALKKGYITPEQLRSALALQAVGVVTPGAAPRALGEILVTRGDLTDSRLSSLLEDQRVRAADPGGLLALDSLLGRVLIDSEQVPPARVHECLRLQATALELGAAVVPRLGELLVQKGYATAEAVGRALARQRKTMLACAGCGHRMSAAAYDPAKVYPCPGCGATLEPTLEVTGPPPPGDPGDRPRRRTDRRRGPGRGPGADRQGHAPAPPVAGGRRHHRVPDGVRQLRRHARAAGSGAGQHPGLGAA